MKFKKPEAKKSEIKKEIKPEVKQEIKKPECQIKASLDLKEVIELQKQGWVVVDIKSVQIGIRPKEWILKKEV